MGCNFVPEKMFSGIKSDFFEFYLIPYGKCQIAMTRSLLERMFLWRRISKSKKANDLKFCLFTSLCMPLLVPNFKSIN